MKRELSLLAVASLVLFASCNGDEADVASEPSAVAPGAMVAAEALAATGFDPNERPGP